MNKQLLTISLGLTLLGVARLAVAQGSLTPPGPPAPTMKTLGQIEPRMPITNVPVTLNTSGSYYLTTNLTGVSGEQGIRINQHNITVDLRGFELRGVPGSASGIFVSGSLSNLCVRNGVISGWNSRGVNGSSARNSQWLDLRVSGNSFGGLETGLNSLVRNCVVADNGGAGIQAGDSSVVESCSVRNAGGDAILVGQGSRVAGCGVFGSGGSGIVTGPDSTVAGCTSVSNSEDGIKVDNGTVVTESTTRLNSNRGIFVLRRGIVSRCVATSNGARGIFGGGNGTVIESSLACSNLTDGIYIEKGRVANCVANENRNHGIFSVNRNHISGNVCNENGLTTGSAGIRSGGYDRVEGNHVTGNAIGIDGRVSGGIIFANTAVANATNYIGAGLTVFGPTNNLTAGGIITNVNPWANFSF